MKKIAIEAINIYQAYLSLPLKMILGTQRICYQSPTCSQYAKDSILKHGFLRGFALGLIRIASCRPALRYD